MPAAGEKWEFQQEEGKIIIEAVEVNSTRDFRGRPAFMIAYRIIDETTKPPFISPVAHLFILKGSDPRKEFERVVNNYVVMKKSIMRPIT